MNKRWMARALAALMLALSLGMATMPAQAAAKYITAAKAKSIALKHARMTTSKVVSLRAKRDREDGRVIYEVEFRSKKNRRIEYEYEIDAKTGRILDWERDYD